MYKAKVIVTLRPSVFDPQGKAVENSLKSIGLSSVLDIRIGKYIEMEIETESYQEAEQVVIEACKKLLSNPVMEDYNFTVQEIQSERSIK
ncbi:MAG: phosphoribosylformylglycinamidine synthase subunit PurS [Ignavibacteriaceae bacterium]|mgnify:CR=1 FL=1|nr:MAG: phosphoribosylformylglycinamidine synthase subunit PurS [Chlorobiota bacterium]MBV6398183.1 Phosphoribosylformylglycinamidine synthase subunit PurS [Ignavibacteria bacterium]MCC6885905.1 phosphoribosylformylglycinamidine synthase subunit PurS [Ignavibacteriales bacterium]MCE7953438.1 phosphoribosylformylglycinamidine synthase subunit PurS [Chlorobi bacterium CHB7]MDL1887374.1 phosphoribosylformylglycinamidine synthase subunit PurS [Ignavibacteria bacterium CHB1]MEB2330063.1 phosphoribo